MQENRHMQTVVLVKFVLDVDEEAISAVNECYTEVRALTDGFTSSSNKLLGPTQCINHFNSFNSSLKRPPD